MLWLVACCPALCGQRDWVCTQGWCLAARCRRDSRLFSLPVSCEGLLSVDLCVCQRGFGLTHSSFLSIVLHVLIY